MIIMLTINANLKKFLKEWMTSTDPKVHRIHLTHTDLDGLACSVILREFYHNLGVKGRQFIYRTKSCSAGKENIDNTITSFFDYIIDNKGINYAESRKFLILITDLGNVNPELFYHYEDLGLNIRFGILDHHQDINHMCDKVKDPVRTPYEVVVNPEENYSAAKLLFEYLKSCGFEYDSHHDPKQYLEDYVKAVSEYDCGHWGNSASDSVVEQFIFSTFDKRNSGRNRYLKLMVDLFTRNDPDAVLDAEIIRKRRYQIAIKDYADAMQMMICDSDLIERESINDDELMQALHIKNIDADVMFYVCSPDDSINNMSIISRMLFKHDKWDRDDIPKILVFVSMERGVIELRSSDDCEVNCAEIATANGGGGHMHAAGFPMNDVVESIIVRKYWSE